MCVKLAAVYLKFSLNLAAQNADLFATMNYDIPIDRQAFFCYILDEPL